MMFPTPVLEDVNTIYGENAAKIRMRTDETTEAQPQERLGKGSTDTPGIGRQGTFSGEGTLFS